jgi:transcription elongation factor GreB
LRVAAVVASLRGMSKAFTREDDDAPERPWVVVTPVLPPGTRNLLTSAGATRLRRELDQLAAERNGATRSPAQEQRLAVLRAALAGAEIIPPPAPPWEQVRFGATVTVRNTAGVEDRYRIVGVAESDPANDAVSWISPIARALLNRRIGERVPFRFPSGADTLEILAVTYDHVG